MQKIAIMMLVAVSLAGCATDEDPSSDAVEPHVDPWWFTIPANATLPSGQVARDYIESYIMTHPFRYYNANDVYTPFMENARDDLESELQGMGLNVTRHDYGSGVNILGFQEGAVNPDEWVVLSAHYDTVLGTGATVYGAWDDGAGTALLMALAEDLAQWEFPFTIVYAFFDGEEKGLVGSREFVNAYGPTENSTIDILANINTDPPGLNWPCGDPTGDFPVKIIHQMGRVDAPEDWPRFRWLYDAVEYSLNETGVPGRVVDYTPGIPVATVQGDGVTGGSDHVSFGQVGVANVFLGGTPTTYATGNPSEGGTAALTYPLHSPLDTLEAMEARCVTGSLAGGLDTIIKMFTHTLTYMAEHPAPEAAVQVE